MKKFVCVVLMVVVLMMGCAFAERERIELTFADDFPYKDDARLKTYGYEYDNGDFEGIIEISDKAILTIFGNESLSDCGFRVDECIGGSWKRSFDVSGLTVDDLNEQYEDKLTKYIGVVLDFDKEGM